MTWDEEIAAHAQAYVDTNPGLAHSSQSYRTVNGEYWGENLAMGSSIMNSGAVVLWYNEISKTSDPSTGLVSSYSSAVGHYTQVVWKNSIRLGCGIANNLMACQYAPGGNIMGSFSSQVPALKSGVSC